jgi:elongation factor G
MNKMDKVGADFLMCVNSMKERLGTNPVPIQWPLGEEDQHKGIIDLIRMKAAVFDEASKGQKFDWVEIPENLKATCKQWHDKLIESCADVDDKIMEKYLEGKTSEITEADLHRALRAGTCSFKLVPVICGSAFKNKGVQMMLDAVVNYLPSPIDVPPVEGLNPEKPKDPPQVRKASDEEPFAALAFKILNDPHGNLTFFRVYSGKISSGTMVLNSTRDKRERIGRILRMHANKREELTEADSGNIYAAVGLRDTRTGDTLCDEKKPILLEKMIFPEPVISIAIEPDQGGRRGNRRQRQLARTRFPPTDEESGQTSAVWAKAPPQDHLRPPKRSSKSKQAAAQVAYREAIPKSPCSTSTPSPAAAASSAVLMEIGRASAAGLRLRNDIVGGVIEGVHPGSRKGVRDGGARRLASFPASADCRLYDGAATTGRLSAQAFGRGVALLRKAPRAGLLLEPIMKNDGALPEQYMGDVIGDLNSRRGKILGMSQRGNAQVIDSEVPLATMFGYVTDLRSMTQGRATSSLHFSHYAPVPAAVQEEIVAKVKGA